MIGMSAAMILSYVIGSLPSGLILGKTVWNTDLREHGSKNIGATNAWRTIGKKAGIAVFAADFLKGAVAVALGNFFVGTPIAMVICGLLAIVGHSLSLFLNFKGGKGVATGLGVIAMLMPTVTIIVFLVWLAIVSVTRYVSLGSIVAAALVPVLAKIFDCPTEYALFGLLAAVIIIWRHNGNIKRLLDGTESKIRAGGR